MSLAISETLELLLSEVALSSEQATDIMQFILSGEAEPSEIAGLLVALRSRKLGAPEFVGFLSAMHEVAQAVPLDARQLGLVDTAGTGGDRSGTINVSTLSALVATASGAKVCKHGNRAVSSASGSADLLEALGIDIEMTPDQVAESIKEVGIGFCFAPLYHPAMRHVGPVRRQLGIPTIFNFLGPLANPAKVSRQLLGVADPNLARTFAEVLRQHGHDHAMIVSGHMGMDELSTTGPSTVMHLRQGEITEEKIHPNDFDIPVATAESLKGGDAKTNARIATQLLQGTAGGGSTSPALVGGSDLQGNPHSDIVMLNAGATLVVAGIATSLDTGIEISRQALESGQAFEVLKQWQDFSTRTRQERA